MPNSILTVLLTAVGVYAVSSAQPVDQTLNLDGPDAPAQRPAQQDMHNLLLQAAGIRVGALEPGKMRIPIPVDGVLYEVIVVSPSLPKLIPTNGNNAE
jgi:hypothetical protein